MMSIHHLYGIANKILKSEELAEDVIQETFVDVWRKINSFDSQKGSLFTWMLNITRNASIDKLRKSKRKLLHETEMNDYNMELLRGGSSSINEDRIGLKDLVDSLSDDQKLIIEYVYLNGYTQQEISEELGIPLGTIKTRVRLAVKALRGYFN